MIRHYRVAFKNPKDILDWIEHDLKHMGLGEAEIEIELKNAKEYLGV